MGQPSNMGTEIMAGDGGLRGELKERVVESNVDT